MNTVVPSKRGVCDVVFWCGGVGHISDCRPRKMDVGLHGGIHPLRYTVRGCRISRIL